MKQFAFLLGLLLILGSCDKTYNKYNCYEPVYTDEGTFRTPASYESPRDIDQDGRIYFKDNFLFVVQPNEGIHFIDNSDPKNPTNKGFLKVMGTSGLAIKDNYLYITALVDLVTIDVSDINNPVEVKREEDIFPTALPLMEKNYPTKTIDKTKGIVTSWNEVPVKEDETVNNFPVWQGCMNCDVAFVSLESMPSNSGGGSGTGTAGSFAMMTIVGDYMYVVDGWKLRPFDISYPTAIKEGDYTYLSWDVETIFPGDDGYLYMGTTTGMLIYNIDDPLNPYREGSISHARACDPVVVQDNYAYVTVRSGGPCGGDINQLDVVDISNHSSPQLIKSFELDNPHGVGIDGTTLFICDGKKGLKVFDATNPETCGDNLIKRFSEIQAVDVIPMNGVAMVIGENGIYQYDYTDPENLDKLSEINF